MSRMENSDFPEVKTYMEHSNEYLNCHYEGKTLHETCASFIRLTDELESLYEKGLITKGQYYREQQGISSCFQYVIALSD